MAQRYNDKDIQRAYEFACEYVCDQENAAIICDQLGKYGSAFTMVTAQEWRERKDDGLVDYVCIIGEDVALDYFVITLV